MTRNKKRGAFIQLHKPLHQPLHEPENDRAAIAEIDRILAHLDTEIPKARKAMDELLSRLRTSRLAA
jgi:hypothetical protein